MDKYESWFSTLGDFSVFKTKLRELIHTKDQQRQKYTLQKVRTDGLKTNFLQVQSSQEKMSGNLSTAIREASTTQQLCIQTSHAIGKQIVAET